MVKHLVHGCFLAYLYTKYKKQMQHLIQPEQLPSLLLAGRAVVTLKSKRTGDHFTIKVRKPEKYKTHLVYLLTGADNTKSYSYIGTINENLYFETTRKSQATPNSKSVQVLQWVHKHRQEPDFIRDRVEFYHNGTCCKCGRMLTTPESITNGIGPECAKMIRKTKTENRWKSN